MPDPSTKVPVKRPGGAWRQDLPNEFSATASEWLPFVFTDAGRLRKKAFLGPAAVLLLAFALLVSYTDKRDPAGFIYVLASFCALAIVYLLYQMCGHPKPWWWLSASSLFMAATILLALPYLYLLPLPSAPGRPADAEAIGAIQTFLRYFVRAGLFEEFWKSLPAFLALWIGRRLRTPWREKLGVWEPLDGILLAVAAASAFGLVENLTVYGPSSEAIARARLASGNEGVQTFLLGELMNTILRSLDFLFGHVAWSGLFGYFIGMAVLRPHSAAKLLTVGYLSAATLHGLWDAAATFHSPIEYVVGLIGYFALAAVILKARKVSPSRSRNFASNVLSAATSPGPVGNRGPALVIAGKPYPLLAGVRLFLNDVPGLNPAASDGAVAEFNVNPKDPSMIGLKNLSTTAWLRTSATGDERIIEPGKSIHLAPGCTIHFGSGRPGIPQGIVR